MTSFYTQYNYVKYTHIELQMLIKRNEIFIFKQLNFLKKSIFKRAKSTTFFALTPPAKHQQKQTQSKPPAKPSTKSPAKP